MNKRVERRLTYVNRYARERDHVEHLPRLRTPQGRARRQTEWGSHRVRLSTFFFIIFLLFFSYPLLFFSFLLSLFFFTDVLMEYPRRMHWSHCRHAESSTSVLAPKCTLVFIFFFLCFYIFIFFSFIFFLYFSLLYFSLLSINIRVGMIIGVSATDADLDVNPVKEKYTSPPLSFPLLSLSSRLTSVSP